MERIATPIESRAQWLEMRRETITASRIGALFECHPHMNLDALAASLRGVDQGDNPAMRRGRIMEPAVAEALGEERPDLCLKKTNTFHLIPELRLGCTPDYLGVSPSGGLVNVQCKTASPQQWEAWHHRPPLAYSLQVCCENLVLDAEVGILAVMVMSPSLPLEIFDVPRHEAAEARILAAVADWWRAWDAGDIPAPAAASDGLAEAFDDGTHRDLSGDNLIREMLEERAALKDTESETAARIKELDYEIKNRIGSARTAWLPGWMLKYPTLHRKEHTVAAGDYRRLTISRTEEC